MTAAALLAFAGAGHTHRAGDYPEVVTKALRWLVDHQKEDGAFRTVHSTAEDRPVYGDALATFALAEIHRQSRSPRLRGTLGRAVSGLVAAQQPYAGWRYLPAARDSDTSVTSLAAFALIAAERSGVPVNPAARFGIRTWMREVTDPTSGRVGYRERGRGSLGMTAAALAVRLLEGEPVGSSSVRAQCELLRENLPSLPAPGAPAPPGNPPDLFYWYFGSVAARHFARADARVWSEAVLAVLPGLQVDSGEARGSFGPFGRWSRVGGRVFTTAFAALVLELAYDFPEAFR
jgi:hypothetical protein